MIAARSPARDEVQMARSIESRSKYRLRPGGSCGPSTAGSQDKHTTPGIGPPITEDRQGGISFWLIASRQLRACACVVCGAGWHMLRVYLQPAGAQPHLKPRKPQKDTRRGGFSAPGVCRNNWQVRCGGSAGVQAPCYFWGCSKKKSASTALKTIGM